MSTDVSRRQLDSVISQAMGRVVQHQKDDGRFSYLCEVSPWASAMAIIVLRLAGVSNPPLIRSQKEILLQTMRPEGGWSVYSDQEFHLSASVLAYFALSLAGVPKTTPDMQRAERKILKAGGLTKVSSLAKAFLACAGQLPWSMFPNTHIELIHQQPDSLVDMFDFPVPLRVHMPSLMILSHLRFKVPMPESCSLRHLVAKGESLRPETSSVPDYAALRACETFLLDRVESDGTIAGYLSATSFFVLALLALGYPVSHPSVAKAISGMARLAYPRNGMLVQQMFDASVWDTALTMRALSHAGVNRHHPRMTRAAMFLLRRQHDLVSDWRVHAPDAAPGGFGFSRDNRHYPDLDDTAAVMLALRPLRRVPLVRDARIAARTWAIAMQNQDGGFGAFEKDVGNPLVKLLGGADLPGILADPSSPDVTGRVLTAISGFDEESPDACNRAVAWLRSMQGTDGWWQGKWGVAFVYGTYLALEGLRAAGVAKTDAAITKAGHWLESVQNDDGGFGESCLSDEQNRFVPLGRSLPSQTAWGLMGLMKASQGITPAMIRAAAWLVDSYVDGGWTENYPTGQGVAGEAYIRYHSYPKVWSLMALGKFRRRMFSG